MINYNCATPEYNHYNDSLNCVYTATVNIRLAASVASGLFFLLVFVAIPGCIFLRRYNAAKTRQHAVQTRIVATASNRGTSVVTSNQVTSIPDTMQSPASTAQLQSTASTVQLQSTASTAQPREQNASKETAFSSTEAPPSYSAAISLPTYTGPLSQVTISKV